jgi:hypothetical protein
MASAEHEEAQRERALKSWELLVLDSPTPVVLDALRRVLRIKRFELPRIKSSIPGVVRRGARVDLAPLEAALTEAGVRCELRRATT